MSNKYKAFSVNHKKGDEHHHMFFIEEKLSIKYYKSSLLEDDSLVHAFTTRMAFDESHDLSDSKNRKKICDALSLNHNLIINPKQQHTSNVKVITGIDDDISNTDGVITSEPELVLMLLFADCVPIMLYAPKERVIGVIHAGWRGTAKKIAHEAISIFTENFNVDAKEIKAAIGAAIGQCCYPVSKSVAWELQKSVNENCGKIFKDIENTDEVKVDLKKLNAQQLIEAGVSEIDTLEICTSCNTDSFYSYRAENAKTGRHAAIASLKQELKCF